MLTLQLTPFPLLRTQRLVLRQLDEQDAPEIFFLRSNEQVMHYICREKMASVAEAATWIEERNAGVARNENISWAICLASSPTLIGHLGFWRIMPEHHRAEIGYILHPDHWNQGIITEALTAMLDYGFRQLRLHTVEANIHPDNKASERLLLKHGFRQEGYLKESYFFRGAFSDTALFSLLNPHP
jgi:[ribosomal protein S5]-alanine N-acetyltransferase